ncbi:diguanylate cyclase [Thioalkalivibrio denitrificans]|uniref:cyclic-guanylate-specific phosphodiesterase n=1 Tax=Thioalkalivibrio denitrificans TaxID=108003 RepID=A0A1V3NKD4_9GAMM|nr:diguanylate cyclase [Thioalkalivibrio denitrificans]
MDNPTLRTLAVLCLLCLALAGGPVWGQAPERSLRVGVYANPPLVSVDRDGSVEGFTVDVLEAIARAEGWHLEYVEASWGELMTSLQAGEIDLLTAIAHTAERARTLSYTREPIFTNWGVVYRHRQGDISSVLDLAGRRIGMLAGDTHAQVMEDMLAEFGVETQVVHGPDYRALLDMTARREVDAAVVNRLVGRVHASPDLVATHIIFNPVEIHYATGREDVLPVLRTIDAHLARLKSDGDSAYHEAVRRWIDATVETPAALPVWLAWALVTAVGMLLLFAVLSVLLRHQVRRRTQELLNKSRALETEIQEHRLAQERLNELAYSDPLTRLPNRALFHDRLQQAMEYAKRHDTLIALLFIDLDDFKRVNDSLGHATGDRLLQAIAQRFEGRLRKTDTLARLGGDEFTVILTDIASPQDTVVLVRSLLESLREPFDLGGQSIRMGASIGITVYPTDDSRETDLLKDAETAMYQAKARGKHTFAFYAPELTRRVSERLVMENELRAALTNDELVVHYQPVVSLSDGQVHSVEALVRWNHPERGMIPPDQFIPVAEESGLITGLGDWVTERACTQISAWDARGLPALAVAINLSAVQFRRDGLVSRLAGSLRSHGLAAHRLHIEITESLLMQKHGHVEETLRTLDAMGMVLAIDDFGTGYSSLSYLRHFPIHVLKVDRSFVNDMVHSPDSRALVEAIVAMAHALRLRVVAEGVETEEQLTALRAMGCDCVQGYLLARPMPPGELADWLEQHLNAHGTKTTGRA